MPNVVTATSVHNYVMIDANDIQLQLRAYNLDGTQLDSLTLEQLGEERPAGWPPAGRPRPGAAPSGSRQPKR